MKDNYGPVKCFQGLVLKLSGRLHVFAPARVTNDIQAQYYRVQILARVINFQSVCLVSCVPYNKVH